jgi:Co/Zn/Cd efflux system component
LGFPLCEGGAATRARRQVDKMGWSKTTRIKVMLAIDILFFFIELTVGFAVHSLALMADAFHMVSIPGCYVIARMGGLMRGGCS